MRGTGKMVGSIRLSYKAWFSVVFLYTVIESQETQASGSHRSIGVCQHYDGECSSRLNSTDHRYINTTLGLSETKKTAKQILGFLKKLYNTKGKDKTCQVTLEKTACFFLFPYCSPDGKRYEYCREDCEYLFEICGEDLNKIIGAGKFITHGKLASKIFRFDECSDLPSVTDASRNITCKHLPFLDIPAKMNSDSSVHKGVIIVLAVLIPFTVFILILCGLHHRRMSKRAKLHSIRYEQGRDDTGEKHDRLSNVVSMRDRIREWKVAPSEMVELVDICKSRGVLDISVDNIEYLKDLGSGQYGLVFQGKVNEDIEGETSRVVAVKTLREGSSPDAIKEFCQEVNIMSTFSHPNVVKLIGVSLAGEPYCMIFEFVEFGDLASFLRNCDELAKDDTSAYPKLSITDQLSMAVQTASGMKYISSIRCVHRDLAARNCLVGRGLVVKISDFGLSRDVYASEYYKMDKTRMLPVRWLPPEAFVDGKFTTYSDVYSYGILLWEIFTFAKLPYEDHDNNKTMELILEGKLLSKPDGCPSPVYDIMMKCWDPNPEKRVLFPEIINDLCSLDDFGQRFEAQEDQIHENFKARSLSNSVKTGNNTSLGLSNKSCSAHDEPPINIDRLPPKPITMKPEGHYVKSPSNTLATGKKLNYDGMVMLSNDNQPANERNEVDAPRAIHDHIPPPDIAPGSYDDDSAPIYGNVDPYDNSNDSQETYDVPPNQEDDEETYSVPPVPRQPKKTCDAPPLSKDYPDSPDETYDIPPQHEDESQETYDVPPKSHEYPDGPQETYDVPPKLQNYPDEPQETYDVPPSTQKQPLIGTDRSNDEQEETYDVPPKKDNDDGEIYENSLQVKPKNGHYSVPNSPFLQRRTEMNRSENLSLPQSRNARRSYENVDFDGNPLLTS